MRTDFACGRHFLRSERSDSGRHKVTLWRPEKMAVRGKDVAENIRDVEDTGITAHFVRLKCGSKHEFISGARPSFGARAVSECDGRGGKQCRAYLRYANIVSRVYQAGELTHSVSVVCRRNTKKHLKADGF